MIFSININWQKTSAYQTLGNISEFRESTNETKNKQNIKFSVPRPAQRSYFEALWSTKWILEKSKTTANKALLMTLSLNRLWEVKDKFLLKLYQDLFSKFPLRNRQNTVEWPYHFSHRDKSMPSTYNIKPVSTARMIERLLFAQNQFSVSSRFL